MEDAAVYGLEEMDFDTDSDVDPEESNPDIKRMHQTLIPSARRPERSALNVLTYFSKL